MSWRKMPQPWYVWASRLEQWIWVRRWRAEIRRSRRARGLTPLPLARRF